MRLHLDYETASTVDLPKTGVYPYAAHESTKILMLGWARDDEDVQLWLPHEEPMPFDLRDGFLDPGVNKHAFNAPFERLITRDVAGIDVPIDQWRCTMVESYYLGFAGGLDTILKAIGLREKDKRGKQLINKFCKPAPKNHKADWYTYENKPEEWLEFCNYCINDVIVERRLWHWIQQFPTMSDRDWQQYFVDQKINERGVLIDVDMCDAAIDIWEREKVTIHEEMKELMGLPKVTRGPFLKWMEENTGVKLESTRKDYLAMMLDKKLLPEEARIYVELWAQKEGKAVSKYVAACKAVGADNRARGMFQYKGAGRTDRAGGRLIQLQNLKRPFVDADEVDTLVSAIRSREPRLLDTVYNRAVSDTLGGAIRHIIKAKEGSTLAVCDLSSIESVVLGWVTNCPLIDETFRAGRDSYKVFATKYFGVEYEDVTKQMRGFSKPPVLGAGYLLGWRGMVAYAEGYGIEMSNDDAKKAVDTFRTMYPEIPVFWKWIYDAIRNVTVSRQTVTGYRLKIERDDHFLRIWLPSGRAISYYSPEVQEQKAPWRNMTDKATMEYKEYQSQGWTDESLIGAGLMKPVDMIMNFTFMGMNNANQWVRLSAHAGGITGNICQSLGGDFLWNGIMNADAAGLEVILHVHDEIGCEVENESDLDILHECMSRLAPWARDMWLGAAGFTLDRYTKD